jgi:hypothetical protein
MAQPLSEDFAIIEFTDEFTDRNYRDVIELISFSTAIDAHHPFNRYPVVYGEVSHRLFS